LIKNHHQKAPFYILHANADAEIAYKQAIKINPNNIDYAFNLSVFYGQTIGNIIDAIKLMKIVYQLDLKDPDPSRVLSSYYLSLGVDHVTGLLTIN